MASVDPKIFGPGIWLTMHLVALKTTKADTRFYWMTKMVISVLMCGPCRESAQSYLEINPITYTGDPHWAFDWWLDFHNHVNREHDRPVWTKSQALNFYTTLLVGSDLPCDDCNLGAIEKIPNII